MFGQVAQAATTSVGTTPDPATTDVPFVLRLCSVCAPFVLSFVLPIVLPLYSLCAPFVREHRQRRPGQSALSVLGRNVENPLYRTRFWGN